MRHESRHVCKVRPAGQDLSTTGLVVINGDYGPGGSSSLPAVAGYPDVTVPAGSWFGLPVGISFFGRANSEATLFKIAYAFEQLTKARQKPMFLPSIPLAV